MYIQVCSNYGPRGSGGATIGKPYLHVLILEKKNLQNQQANFNQTWHKSSLGKGNSKGQVIFKGEIITKNAKNL
jgi:hypothetical protein